MHTETEKVNASFAVAGLFVSMDVDVDSAQLAVAVASASMASAKVAANGAAESAFASIGS